MAGTSGKSSLLKGRGFIWILSFAFALLAGFGVLAIVGSAAEQGTYYVVTQDLPAGTQLSPAVVESRTANIDGVPATALTLAELNEKPLYTAIPLRSGDVLIASVVNTGNRITAGLPADYVAASLEIDPANAAAGKIRAGDIVDIAAISESGAAKIVLHGILVIDVATAPSTVARAATADEAAAQDAPKVKDGTPLLYTFAVSPADFAALALLRDNDVYLALTQGATAVGVDVTVNEQDLFRPGTVAPGTPTTGDDTTAITGDDTTVAPSPSSGPAPAPAPTAVTPSAQPTP